MTDKPKTFEEAAVKYCKGWTGGVGPSRLVGFQDGWHARDDELAEKDRRIAELERERDAYAQDKYELIAKNHDEVCALEARIAAGMALAKRMEQAGMVYWTNEFRAALKGES